MGIWRSTAKPCTPGKAWLTSPDTPIAYSISWDLRTARLTFFLNSSRLSLQSFCTINTAGEFQAKGVPLSAWRTNSATFWTCIHIAVVTISPFSKKITQMFV
jgi:hypothetical protein